MSLVGNLEDLGLGDILQIVSLSRKSGVLLLRSDQGEGQFIFRDGCVTAALVKGAATDLRTLLVQSGDVDEADFDGAAAAAKERGEALEAVLVERTELTPERIDQLRRENAEQAAYQMFTWLAGDFSFDVRSLRGVDRALEIPVGIEAQFLAMEGARVRDEAAREGSDAEPSEAADPASFADLAADVSAEAAETLPPDAAAESGSGPTPAQEQAGSEAATSRDAAAPPSTPPPVIVIDPSLPVLEWVKATLADQPSRVHIFQKTELGISRIRQYLARSELPLVLLSTSAPPDPISGARDAEEIVKRLKAQAPSMAVLQLAEPRSEERVAGVDGAVEKASADELTNPHRMDRLEARSQALLEQLGPWTGGAPASSG